MCTGKCSKCIAVSLYPLAVASIVCNLILFFPDWKTEYVEAEKEGDGQRITAEVKYMGGVIGGGVMVLIPAIHIHLTSKKGCCGNRCGMFLSIAFAAVGVVGALYSFIVAVLGLVNGPTCYYFVPSNPTLGIWGTPFAGPNASYLDDHSLWSLCEIPHNVVEFNVGLFSALLVVGVLELVLCAFQMINGLFGCICGTCNNKAQSA